MVSKRLMVIWLLCWLPCMHVWAAANLTEPAAPAAVKDDRGAVIQLKKVPQRVLTLLPSLTEAVCVLDACQRLVGVDRWSNWPESVQGLPKVGGLDDANVEAIVALRPDLVLASSSSRLAQRLRALGVPIAEFEAQTLNDVPRVLKEVATLLGQPEKAEPVWQRVRDQLQHAQDQVPVSVKGTRVYFEVATAPYAAGESSFIGQLLTHLGVRNVVPESLGPFPKLNPEYVVRADPDLIILAQQDVPSLARRPGWSSLRAMRLGRVCGLKPSDYDLLARPGPRLGQAAGVLLTCLQKHAVALQQQNGKR